MHENQMHPASSFITLTYDDEHVPTDYSLKYSDFQKFMKRLRKRCSIPVKYFMCGEYGETFSRPHFHACLFGVFFEDREFFRNSESGSRVYTSKSLSELWPFGYATVGDVMFESAAYVARYVMKKVTGPKAEEHYKIVDFATGELKSREPEFCHMSLKPGIGLAWYERYRKEVWANDGVVLRGRKMKPPKYYDILLEKEKSLESDEIEYERYLRSLEMNKEDQTEERLRVRETVKIASINQLKRNIL